MTTTYPNSVPTGYAGDYTDFLKVQRDTFGALRSKYTVIAVADNATAGTVYGLLPFQKGAQVGYGSAFASDDLDTASNVTWNLGYLYEDSDDAGAASDADAFASALSGQASALLSFDEKAGLSFVAAGNGWIVATMAAGPVTTAGNIEARLDITYG